MSIILPGNTAGFSTDTPPDLREWTTAHKVGGKTMMRDRRKVKVDFSKLRGLFLLLDSKPYIVDLLCQFFQKDRSGLCVEDELTPNIAAGVGADDRNVLAMKHILCKLNIALTDVHERICDVQNNAPAENLSTKIALVRAKLQQLFDKLRDGNVSIFRRSQPFAVPKGQHVVVDAAPTPNAIPETDRHARAKNGRDDVPLLVYEEAAGKKIMAVLILIIEH